MHIEEALSQPYRAEFIKGNKKVIERSHKSRTLKSNTSQECAQRIIPTTNGFVNEMKKETHQRNYEMGSPIMYRRTKTLRIYG